MSAEHVQNCLKLQRLKPFSRLRNEIFLEHTENECCKQSLNDQELEELDNCFEGALDLSEIEWSSLYYISGYVCHKEDLETAPAPSFDLPASEFTTNVSRGNLRHPPMDLYNLSLYLYSYYNSIEDTSCTKKVMNTFTIIYSPYYNDLNHYIQSILQRYLNTFNIIYSPFNIIYSPYYNDIWIHLTLYTVHITTISEYI